MSTRQVRPRRSAGPVVAVTGAADGIGRALVARLAASADVRKVVALDDHRGDVPGVTWRVVDIRDPQLTSRISDVDVIVHLDIDQSPETDHRERRAYNVRGTQTVITAAAAVRVRRVILVTSAMVYGAQEGNPVPLPEDSPTAAEFDDGIVGDFLEIEELAGMAPVAHPGMTVTVLRPAALVGPGIDTVVTRHFEAPRLLTVKGTAQRWQFCHVDDLVTALDLAVSGEVSGRLRGRLRGLAGAGGGRGDHRTAGVSNCPRRSPSARPSACTVSGSPRRPPPTCTTSSTRGWPTAPPCARPGGNPRATTPRR